MRLKLFLAAACVAACTHSVPPPDQRLIEALDVLRDAKGLVPQGDDVSRGVVALANDEVERGMALMREGKNAEAAVLLTRARVDGELALQLGREAIMKQRVRDARATVTATREQR
jgi:hypothetical protein